MKNKTTLAGRSLVAGAIGTLTLAVSGIGIAAATNGGSLVLGQGNEASSTTTLKDTGETPLSLVTKDDQPPLKVSNDQLIKHLNAEKLGGLTSGELSSGSSAQLQLPLLNPKAQREVFLPKAGSDDYSSIKPVSVFETAKLDAGTYAVTATALGYNAFCWVDTVDTTRREQYAVTEEGTSAVLTLTVNVHDGERIHTYCAADIGLTEMMARSSAKARALPEVTSTDPGEILSGGMTVVKIQSVHAGQTGPTKLIPLL